MVGLLVKIIGIVKTGTFKVPYDATFRTEADGKPINFVQSVVLINDFIVLYIY